jgi:hypothetical protein
MGRKRTYAPLDVYMNGRRLGQYFRAPDGAFAFTYVPEWLEGTQCTRRTAASTCGAAASCPYAKVGEGPLATMRWPQHHYQTPTASPPSFKYHRHAAQDVHGLPFGQNPARRN